MRKILPLTLLTVVSSCALGYEYKVDDGWSLLGSVEALELSKFDDSCVDTIWIFDKSWSLFIPGKANSGVTSIEAGVGFWAKAEEGCSIDTYESTNETISYDDITYGTITSSVTGKIWLDKNLGASKVCDSYDDSACYGDYYQWGRAADGHEKANSEYTTAKVDTLEPGHSLFIIDGDDWSGDWTTADSDYSIRSTQWDICPAGFRVPTITEIENELFIDANDAFSKLKLPLAGDRSNWGDAVIWNKDSIGAYWTSTVNNEFIRSLYISINNENNPISTTSGTKNQGYQVRCIED
jgi:uncharacterized protein (TIGR02145 family)